MPSIWRRDSAVQRLHGQPIDAVKRKLQCQYDVNRIYFASAKARTQHIPPGIRHAA
jgi:hypothetical protein